MKHMPISYIQTFLIVFLAFAFSAAHGDAIAEDKPADNAGAEAIQKSIAEIYDSLDEKERQHFFLIYNNYNIIESVKIVRDDVKAAVVSCGENNPEIKVLMDSRYKSWSDAVEPVLKESSANLQNMILVQDYASSDQIKNVLDSIDATRELVDSQIKKVPVSTPEACEFLREKMNETQEQLIQLLKTALKTVPQAFSETGKDTEL